MHLAYTNSTGVTEEYAVDLLHFRILRYKLERLCLSNTKSLILYFDVNPDFSCDYFVHFTISRNNPECLTDCTKISYEARSIPPRAAHQMMVRPGRESLFKEKVRCN